MAAGRSAWPLLASVLLLGLAGCEGSVSLPNVTFSNVTLPKLPFLSGGESTSTPASISNLGVGDEVLTTNALTGEECRVRKLAGGGAAFEDLVVLCGGWTEPSGRIRRFLSAADAPLAPLLDTPELALWAPAAAECEPARGATLANGADMMVRDCTKSDGWPMLAWAGHGKIGDKPATYAGYGLPHLAPVVENLLTGRDVSVVQGGSRSPLVQAAESRIVGANGTISLDSIMSFRHLIELGIAYNQAGEFAEAVNAYERALDIKRQGLGGRDSFSAPVLAALGLNLASDAREEEARLAFEEAAPLAEQIRSSEAYPTYLAYRAAFARRFETLGQARDLARQATDLRVAMLGPQSSAVGAGLLLQSGIALDAGDIALARDLMRRAEALFVAAGEPVSLAFTHAARARLERQAGQLTEAAEQGKRAVEEMEQLFGEGLNLAEAAIELGATEAARGDTAAALTWLNRGMQAAERGRLAKSYLRPDQTEALLQTLFAEAERGDRAALYGQAVRAMQLPRGVTFEKALRRMTARLAAADPELQLVVRQLEAAQEREQEARGALGRLRLENPTQAAGRSEQELQATIASAQDEARRLESRLQVQHPRYGALIVPKLVELGDLRTILAPGEAVLRISTTDQATYAVLADATGRIAGYRGALGAESLAARVRQLRQALTFEHGLQPFDLRAASDLTAALLGPLDLTGVRHLIVVADGPLLSLPIELLPLRPVRDGSDYRDVAWLGRDIAVSNLPSLAGLATFRQAVQPSQATAPFLGVGDPRLGGGGAGGLAARAAYEACQNGDTYDPALLQALAPLPETADELRDEASLLGAGSEDVLLGDAATESRVRALDLRRYRVIAFATHGLLPGEIRCRGEPGLVLSPPRRATDEDDGLLAASEIARLDLDAELVVLSACNTAGPDGTLGGEALSGLATAFTYAGARRLIVSHWDVASEPTVALMRRAMGEMDRGMATALLDARRQLMDNARFAHPAFWAPFVLVGDGGRPGIGA